ncbi:MAG: signal recognition particle-docking protein FtsY [Chlamydiota bacterium]
MFQSIKRTFQKIRSSFTSFKSQLGRKIREIFSKNVDESSFEELEQLLFEADLGAELASSLVDQVRLLYRKDPDLPPEKLIASIKQELLSILMPTKPLPLLASPHIILMVGVNGSGKTTTIAKLANYYKEQGKKVLISASDTFRAAAVEQVEHWAKKIGVDLVKSAPKADPSSVVFDAITSAMAKNVDVVLIDTAGRLHTKTDLMQELAKITRTVRKKVPEAPHETFLVIDASSGQNAIDQAEIFDQYTNISSIILTKLDGSAKGGIVVALKQKKNLDVRFVGTGESASSLSPFDPEAFVEALLKE